MLHQASAMGATHDSDERYPPPKCHPETRKAVLDTILKWADGRNSGILSLYGPAGAGKSAIAQTIAEYCAKERRLGASFFFSRGKMGRSNAARVFPTIAYQLAISVPEIRTFIERIVEDDPSIINKSRDIQLQKLIIEPHQAITPSESLNLPKVIIIDGLDECEEVSVQQHILSLLGHALADRQLPLRLFITSRPEPHIRDTFDRFVPQYICHHITLDNSFLPDKDIYTFLRSGFTDIHDSHHHTMASILKPWPSEAAIDFLVQKSSGQFIYASTVLKFIDDGDCRPPEQLKIVMGITGSNSTAFTALDHLYHQILSTNSDTNRLLLILGIIITLHHPLSVHHIECLLSLKDGDVRLGLRRLHSLLDIPDPNPSSVHLPIRLHHASFSDFLTDPVRSGQFFIQTTTHHTHLTCLCLRTLKEWASALSTGVATEWYADNFS